MPHLHRGKPGFVACAAEPISGESGLHTLVVSAVFPAPSHLFAKIISKSRSKSRLPLDIWEKASYLEGALFARPGVAEISKCMVGNLRVGLWVCARLPLGRFELSCPLYCVCVEICVERSVPIGGALSWPPLPAQSRSAARHGGILGRCALWRWRPMMWGREQMCDHRRSSLSGWTTVLSSSLVMMSSAGLRSTTTAPVNQQPLCIEFPGGGGGAGQQILTRLDEMRRLVYLYVVKCGQMS